MPKRRSVSNGKFNKKTQRLMRRLGTGPAVPQGVEPENAASKQDEANPAGFDAYAAGLEKESKAIKKREDRAKKRLAIR